MTRPPKERTDDELQEPARLPAAPPELLEEDPLRGDPLAQDRIAKLVAAIYADTRLAEQLLVLPPDEREAQVLQDRRFQRQNLATLFALRAEAALEAPPVEAVEAAALAVTIATTVPPDGRGKAQRTAALAAWLLGKALLRTGDQDLAEDAFASIVTLLPGTGLSEEYGLGPIGLAQLRWQQDLPDEAGILFTEAAAVFSHLHHANGTAACLAQAGFVLLGRGEHSPAKNALRAADRAIVPRHAPSLAILVCLALVGCDAAQGRHTRARDDLDKARAHVDPASLPAGLILGSWWEALVAHLLGPPPSQTDAKVDEVRRGLLQQGLEPDAIRITFHQVLLRIAANQPAAVPGLTSALAAAFPGAQPWAKEMAALCGLATEPAPALLDAATDLALRLAVEALQQPGLPGLAPSLGALADHLLRHRGEHMNAIGSPTAH